MMTREIGFSHFMYIVKIWHIPWTFGDSFNRRFNFAFETSKCGVSGSITWMARVYNAYIQRKKDWSQLPDAQNRADKTQLSAVVLNTAPRLKPLEEPCIRSSEQ